MGGKKCCQKAYGVCDSLALSDSPSFLAAAGSQPLVFPNHRLMWVMIWFPLSCVLCVCFKKSNPPKTLHTQLIKTVLASLILLKWFLQCWDKQMEASSSVPSRVFTIIHRFFWLLWALYFISLINSALINWKKKKKGTGVHIIWFQTSLISLVFHFLGKIIHILREKNAKSSVFCCIYHHCSLLRTFKMLSVCL